MKRILFVCLGNICRSPMAEGVFKDLLEKNSLTGDIYCESAGTAAYHEGELPDSRMRDTARQHAIKLISRARQIIPEDLEEFDYILAMDKSNYQNIIHLAKQSGNTKAQVIMMRDFDPEGKGRDVPDPYYGGLDGFENVYQILKRSNENFLDFLKQDT